MGSWWTWGGHSTRQWWSLESCYMGDHWLSGKLTCSYRPVSLLNAVMILSKPRVPFLSIYSTQLWASKQRKYLFYIYFTNKKLKVDNLCPLWQTKWIFYMTPISHFHDNRTPISYDITVWPAIYPSFKLLWQLQWPFDTVLVNEK